MANFFNVPGVDLIRFERMEQLDKHGRTVEQDVALNTDEQLIDGALLLILSLHEANNDVNLVSYPPKGWDKDIWQHILGKSHKEKLTIAGTFLAAEIDRLQYIENEDNN